MLKNICKKIICLIRNYPFIIIAVVTVLLFILLPLFPWAAEYIFARGLFKIISIPVSSVISVFPFSITEIACILSIPALIILIAIFIIQLRKSCKKRDVLKKWFKHTGWLVSCALLIYMIMHGANYYSYEIDELIGLDNVVLIENDDDKKEAMTDQLLTVCKDLAEKAEFERERLAEDGNGCMILSGSIYQMLQQAPKIYENIEEKYPFLKGGALSAKPVMLSHYWSYTGIAGMYFPFWCEANINIDAPQCTLPSTIAHELAHTKGFAREGDCNFIAYLACISSDSAEFRYSGYLMALNYCANELHALNSIEWAKLMLSLSNSIHRDLTQQGNYWAQFDKSTVMSVSTSVNEVFLSSQGQSSGVQSYSNIVGLILKEYKIKGLI